MKNRVQYLALSLGLLLFLLTAQQALLARGSTSTGEPVAQGNVDAGQLFAKSCAKCHGAGGGGGARGRNLTSAKWQGSVTDERIFNSIANGRERMPAFGKKLNDAQIDALVAYV
ncbi:MAG: cytochrome c, partial [Acidobacteria bacterium]|nr:cytochrome c [Acidobacteriota bacterium]